MSRNNRFRNRDAEYVMPVCTFHSALALMNPREYFLSYRSAALQNFKPSKLSVMYMYELHAYNAISPRVEKNALLHSIGIHFIVTQAKIFRCVHSSVRKARHSPSSGVHLYSTKHCTLQWHYAMHRMSARLAGDRELQSNRSVARITLHFSGVPANCQLVPSLYMLAPRLKFCLLCARTIGGRARAFTRHSRNNFDPLMRRCLLSNRVPHPIAVME